MWNRLTELSRSLAFRLTLLYVGLCGLTMIMVLTVSYVLLKSYLQRHLDNELLAEVAEYEALLETQPLALMQEILDQEVASEGLDKMFFRIYDDQGRQVLTTDTTAWPALTVHGETLLAARSGRDVFEDIRHLEDPYPTRVIHAATPRGWVFQIGYTSMHNAEILRRFQQVFLLSAGGFLLCSVVAGHLLARRALLGVNRAAQAARAITAGQWDRRVAVSKYNDEVDQLALAFNEMLDRIQQLIQELRNVTDDIAHDLRTPIARMHFAAEAVLSHKDALDEAFVEEMLGECRGLLALINKMLDISQTEAGVKTIQQAPLDLADIAREVFDLFEPAGEDKGLALHFVSDGDTQFRGDAQALSRAIAQVMDNAVKYTEPGGRIEMICGGTSDSVRVAISDTGQGITEEERDKVFTRFYRSDPSRSKAGNGLGLSLAKAIVGAHGGEITLHSVPLGGSTFTLILPR